MKKFLALLLSMILVLSLTACGGGGGEDSKPADESKPADTQPPADSGSEPAEGKTVKVGLICIGDENDQGYTYNFIRGKEAATEALAAKGINVEWVTKWNIGEDSG